MSRMKIEVNGSEHLVSATADTPLLYILRDELHLHGPRFGCGLAQCGACTVHLGNGAVRSCVTPVAAVIGSLAVIFSVDYMRGEAQLGRYYALVLLSTLGMMLISAATDLISIFVALELISISLYALVGFLKDAKSTEASLKYMLLGAIASAILLYGMAFIFGFTGTIPMYGNETGARS